MRREKSGTLTPPSLAQWPAVPIRCRGFYDKFYDQDMRPLLSLEQDTVGRHDTFALACTARGYEEKGFPGHVNCSDNISNEYAKYGIAPRAAWPAINFFFNSWIAPGDSRLRVDEAWSRPGDYVLMRAMSPLVCVSTACPDDIDPINGWNPTDIYVRIYSSLRVRRGMVYRSFPGLPKTMTQPSPFHKRTAALTSRFVAAKDIWAPAVFDSTGMLEEYWACRRRVTMQDTSSLRKLDVCGPDAGRFLQTACTRDIRRLAVHRAVYALFCDSRGAVIDDAVIYRLAPSLFRVCHGGDELALHLREQAEKTGCKVWLREKSRMLCSIAVQGPKSKDTLRRLIFTQPSQPAFENLKWFGMTLGRLRNRVGASVMVSRSGYTGELGYELFCDRRDAEEMWDAVISSGKEQGIAPMGGGSAGSAASGGRIDGQQRRIRRRYFAGRGGAGILPWTRTRAIFAAKKLSQIIVRAVKLSVCWWKVARCPFAATEFLSVGGRRERSPARCTPLSWSAPSPWRECTGMRRHLAPGWRFGKLDGHIKRLAATVCELPFTDPKRKKLRE